MHLVDRPERIPTSSLERRDSSRTRARKCVKVSPRLPATYWLSSYRVSTRHD